MWLSESPMRLLLSVMGPRNHPSVLEAGLRCSRLSFHHTLTPLFLCVCACGFHQALCKGFGDKLLLDNVNFIIPPGALVGIVGGNGAGKTTLFRMIMGQMEPDSGELKVGDTVAPMYVDQSRDALSADKTVYEEISEGNDEVVLGSRSISARAYCSWYVYTRTPMRFTRGEASVVSRRRFCV
jgi:hypothetical protein